MKPDGKPRPPGSPEQWIDHAQSDLRLARLAAQDLSIRREQACFHSQQAAEKAIKAALLFRRVEFPLTHDIEQLLEIAQAGGIAPPPEVREAGLLTPYAVETRYPGSWGEIAGEELDEALRTAELVLDWGIGGHDPDLLV